MKPTLETHDILPREEVISLVQAAQAGDLAARDRVVVHFQRLIAQTADRFGYQAGICRLDLIQEGNIALLRAIRTFNPGRGAFTTHVVTCARRAMITWRMRRGTIIHMKSLPDVCKDTLQRLLDGPNINLVQHSLDANDRQLAEFIAAEAQQRVLARVQRAIEQLPPESQLLLSQYQAGMTLRQLGELYGTSRTTISNRLQVIYCRLRSRSWLSPEAA